METIDLSYLQKEIALRGRIIEALVNGNEELNHKYEALVSFLRSKAETYSPSEKEMLEKIIGNPISEKGKGITERSYSLTEKGNGITNLPNALPEKIDTTKFPRITLQQNVKAHIKFKGRRSTTSANADLLIHIYNGGDCGYPTLRKVTHLSTGGLGKRLMSLTKRGLIKRTGLQKLALTESALNLLRQSYAGSVKQ